MKTKKDLDRLDESLKRIPRPIIYRDPPRQDRPKPPGWLEKHDPVGIEQARAHGPYALTRHPERP